MAGTGNLSFSLAIKLIVIQTVKETVKTFFIVTSYGRTATTWLAAILNSHPQILCSHGPVMPEDYFHARPELVAIHSNMKTFFSLSLDHHFAEFEKLGKARAYGNVHGYALDWLHARFLKEPPVKEILVINQTRHPVTRIESMHQAWLLQMKKSPALLAILQDMHKNAAWQEMCERIDHFHPHVMSDLGPWVFVTALLKTITTDAIELSMTAYPHFTMEGLTKDPAILHSLISAILPDISQAETDALFSSSPRVNHTSPQEKEVEEVFKQWDGWKRELFSRIPEISGINLIGLYAPFGYEISPFLK